MGKRKRKTVWELIEELRLFHHNEAANELERLARKEQADAETR